MTRSDLLAAIRDAPTQALLAWIGACAEGQALALARLVAPAPNPRHTEPPAQQDEVARCLSVQETALRLGLDEGKVYDLLRTGRLPGFKEGKYWLVPLRALDEHVELHLDKSLYSSYIRASGRAGASTDPCSAGADAGRHRQASGSRRQYGGKVGARRGTGQRGDVATRATRGPVGAEE